MGSLPPSNNEHCALGLREDGRISSTLGSMPESGVVLVHAGVATVTAVTASNFRSTEVAGRHVHDLGKQLAAAN